MFANLKGIIDALKRFIEHRIDVVRRRTDYLLRKAREREHILLGFKKALENLDEVIAMIRSSKTPREAKDKLIAAFEFSERQSQAIIELQLQRLTNMEQQKILDELAEIQRLINEYLEILGSEKVLRALIVKELREVMKDFGDERRTVILEDTGDIDLEDLIQEEDVAITVTRSGYLKRTSVDTYRRQTRGGKGRIGMTTRSEDVVEHLIIGSTHAYLLIFTTKGRVYWLKNYAIPDAGTVSKGKHIAGLINLQQDEGVQAFLPVRHFTEGTFVVMVTRQGVIKRCSLSEFDNPMSRGIIDEPLRPGTYRINPYAYRVEKRPAVKIEPGEVGELVVRGPQVMLGYWNNPEATKNILRDGWLYTGDLATRDADGYFKIVDRKKDLIIRGGANIYPGDVEEVLYGHPTVAECAVVGKPDELYGERVTAYIVPKPAAANSIEDLRAHCRERLASYKVPADIIMIDSLPKGPTGKILKRVLRDRA